MKKIFITGGAGYVGSKMAPYFLNKGYKVTVYDIMYFTDNFLPKNDNNLKIISGDIRDTEKLKASCEDHDYFIHLACISNDASFELDENLSKTINYDCFESLVLAAKEKRIKRFIYASTSSVYGVSSSDNVKEDHPLVPLTFYNDFKGRCEPILLKHTDDNFKGVIFRPATVCGYAPRQRLDLTVNILSNFAFNKGFIKVFGGDQMRPNLHIDDYIEAVDIFINAPIEKVENQIFNVGFQNYTVRDLAKIVSNTIKKENNNDIEIIFEKSDDNRSYHINSDKIKEALDFKPKRSIEDAIIELTKAMQDGLLPNSFDDDIYFNVKRLKSIKAL
tara:strand:+ start:7249 stop:8244 length:996 start_codon:yes stop_codon:yes gene_type:complete